jgi:hypothetical protein
MPLIVGARVPAFMAALRDQGWEAANQKRGGGVAGVSGRYLATIQDGALDEWFIVLTRIPRHKHEFLQDIFRHFVMARGALSDGVRIRVVRHLRRAVTNNNMLPMGMRGDSTTWWSDADLTVWAQFANEGTN